MSLATQRLGSGQPDEDAIRVDGQLVQLMGSLGHMRGGLTRSVYARLWAVEEGTPITIAVTGYQHDVEKVFQELIDSRAIPPHTKLRSYFTDISQDARIANHGPLAQESLEPVISKVADTVREEAADDGSVVRRMYSNGRFLGLERYSHNGALRYIDVHREDQVHLPAYRDYYDGRDSPHLRQYLDDAFKARYHIYYTPAGCAYASHWVSPGGRAYRFTQFANDAASHYEDLDAARAAWVQGLCAPHGRTVVVSDEPATMHALQNRSSEKEQLHVGVIHTVHFLNNWDAREGYKSWLTWYQDPKTVDRVVVTTEAQAQDLRKELPAEFTGRVYVASHAAPVPVDRNMDEGRRFNVVVVGRLDPNKRVDLATRAFGRARKSEPRLRLTIYGAGADSSRLKELVIELQLTDVVKFAGHVADSDAIYSSAGIQLFTSKFEGFGLVLTEGFSQGVPAIASDVPYGPRDLIEPGTNGYLVESGGVEDMANALVRLSRSARVWRKLSGGALRTAAKRDRASWVKAWSAVHDFEGRATP